MVTHLPLCPCGLSRDEAKLCINLQGICQAVDANRNPCNKRLADHPTNTQHQGKLLHSFLSYVYFYERLVNIYFHVSIYCFTCNFMLIFLLIGFALF